MRGSKITKQGELTQQMIGEMPDAPNLTIARLLRKKYPRHYASVESARNSVRYMRGMMGERHRESLVDKRFVLPKPTKENPLSIPESDEHPYVPYLLPPQCGLGLILPDMHVPYHVMGAVTLALKYAKKRGINWVCILGDGMDCHTLSRFEKDPDAKDFKAEKQAMRHMLMAIRNLYGDNAHFIYKQGNHEKRFQSYLVNHASEIYDSKETRLDVILGLHEIGAEWLNMDRIIKVGKLNMLHGDEYKGGGDGGVNPARSLFLKSKACALEAHFHRSSFHSEPTLNDNLLATWSLGCLCELHPPYMRLNKWNLGFAMVEQLDDQNFHVENKRIISGKIVGE